MHTQRLHQGEDKRRMSMHVPKPDWEGGCYLDHRVHILENKCWPDSQHLFSQTFQTIWLTSTGDRLLWKGHESKASVSIIFCQTHMLSAAQYPQDHVEDVDS